MTECRLEKARRDSGKPHHQRPKQTITPNPARVAKVWTVTRAAGGAVCRIPAESQKAEGVYYDFIGVHETPPMVAIDAKD